MKITFLVPSRGNGPSGGVKVIYEYANGLSRRGHDVCVIHFLPQQTSYPSLKRIFYVLAKKSGIERAFGPSSWMNVDKRINVILLGKACLEGIPKGDVIIACTWWLADVLKDASINYGRRYQFIQEYEYFMTANKYTRQRMTETYLGPLDNIVISPACRSMVESVGGAVHSEIPNGLDHDVFRLIEPIDSVKRISIGFAARNESFKRTQDAISAIKLIKQKVSKDIEFWCFGAVKPSNLPDWCRFEKRPSDDDMVALHNHSAVFIVPSEYEGWGLPGSEAMCCGAVLVSTRNGGVEAYAKNNDTAVLVDVGNPQMIANAVIDLLSDNSKRQLMARRGNEFIRQMTWERSILAMENSITEVVKT